MNKHKVKWIRGLCLKENEGWVDAFAGILALWQMLCLDAWEALQCPTPC